MQRLRFIAVVLGASALAATAALALGGGATTTRADGQHAERWWRPPADVRAMLRAVSPRRLERYDRALVGFGTRHTLSVQDDPARGIGAARDWIKCRVRPDRRHAPAGA